MCQCNDYMIGADCVKRACYMCCDLPLCYDHYNCYRKDEYHRALETFKEALNGCNLFTPDIVEHIFTAYVDERPVCKICNARGGFDDYQEVVCKDCMDDFDEKCDQCKIVCDDCYYNVMTQSESDGDDM